MKDCLAPVKITGHAQAVDVTPGRQGQEERGGVKRDRGVGMAGGAQE